MSASRPIALKNPQNAPAPNSSIWAATLGISADCALKARRTVTGGRLSANAGSPSQNISKGLSGLYNRDRVENPSFRLRSYASVGRRHACRLLYAGGLKRPVDAPTSDTEGVRDLSHRPT